MIIYKKLMRSNVVWTQLTLTISSFVIHRVKKFIYVKMTELSFLGEKIK